MQWIAGVKPDVRLVRFLEFEEESRDENRCDAANGEYRMSEQSRPAEVSKKEQAYGAVNTVTTLAPLLEVPASC